MNLAGFDYPRVYKKKILCLYSPTLQACLTIIIFTMCKVSKRSWRTWLVFPKTISSQNSLTKLLIRTKLTKLLTVRVECLLNSGTLLNCTVNVNVKSKNRSNKAFFLSCVLLFLIDFQTRCSLPRYQGASM